MVSISKSNCLEYYPFLYTMEMLRLRVVPGTNLIPDLSPSLAPVLVPSSYPAATFDLMPSICLVPSELLTLAVTSSIWFSALAWLSLVKDPQCHRCSSEAVDVCRLLCLPIFTFSSWQTNLFVFFCPFTKNIIFGNDCLLPSWDILAPCFIQCDNSCSS